MRFQSRDADVASAELIEEKRLSRELSAQVHDFTEGVHSLGLLSGSGCCHQTTCSA